MSRYALGVQAKEELYLKNGMIFRLNHIAKFLQIPNINRDKFLVYSEASDVYSNKAVKDKTPKTKTKVHCRKSDKTVN